MPYTVSAQNLRCYKLKQPIPLYSIYLTIKWGGGGLVLVQDTLTRILVSWLFDRSTPPSVSILDNVSLGGRDVQNFTRIHIHI